MKKLIKIIFILLFTSILYFIYANYPRLDIITGFSARNMASSIFYGSRTQKYIEENGNGFPPISFAKNVVNHSERSVTSTVFGLNKRKAIYIDGIGAILVNKDYDPDEKFTTPKRNKITTELPYPYGDLPQNDTIFENVDYDKLGNVMEDIIDNSPESKTRTNSVLVVYKDHIIAEKYSDGLDENSPMLGWSMTKSVVSTIYGILNKQGKFELNDKVLISDWQNDSRKDITYNNLLQMNSGLEWEEDYFSISDVTKMLYLETNMDQAQLKNSLVGKPNETWNYSSGTTNLLSGYLLRRFFNTHQEYLDFWYNELLDKIGMHSALIETDLGGSFIGSTYSWANTRDWAKFGLLYLHKGNWNGQQIIDSTWVKYVSEPTNDSNGKYGAHFWLNAGGKYPDVPKDMFSANGFQGQYVFIIPSRELVVVRTGLNQNPDFDINAFLRDILNSVCP